MPRVWLKQRLEFATQSGATQAINPLKTKDVIKVIFDVKDGYGVDLAVKSTSKDTIIRQSCDAVLAIGASRSATPHYDVGEFIRKSTRVLGICRGACTPPIVRPSSRTC